MYQQVAGLGVKTIGYEYDLASGKVNFVSYQHGRPDQFYYGYKYDQENRLTEAWSSIQANVVSYGIGSSLNPAIKKLDAAYQYYLHGPLARMTLGNLGNKVQGLDYAYTLQGWLKGVNGNTLRAGSTVGGDVMAYSLGYYTGDYSAIGGSSTFGMQWQPGGETGNALYNGNISTSTVAIKGIGNDLPSGYTYGYDQLNRLVKMRQHDLNTTTTVWNSGNNVGNKYKEDYTYDGNGNILTLKRNGAGGQLMDDLNYAYHRDGSKNLVNNKLDSVGQSNYTYDAIGNLIGDSKENISGIDWTVYGKIKNITRNGQNISYTYDAGGNRVSKTSGNITTWYVRDAQGNPLGVYDNNGGVFWREQQLYGSSRLGMWRPDTTLVNGAAAIKWDRAGKKSYELSNHLGNVLAVVSDKYAVEGGSPVAELLSAQDYYPFGMIQPGRSISSANYRYGFNGKENDNEVKGVGNQQDYGMRIYDPRVGRFLSVDPIAKQYPELTPYQFASNTPIWAVDRDGLEAALYNGANLSTSEVFAKSLSKLVDNVAGWLKSPADNAMKQGLAYQVNYNSTGVHLTANDFRGLTRGEYLVNSVGQSLVSNLNHDLLVRMPQNPHVKVNVSAEKTKLTLSVHEPVSENNVLVYRTQGGVLPNSSRERVIIGGDGSVSIKGSSMLFVTLDDKSHQVYFYNKRGGANNGASISSFEIPESLAKEIRTNAVSQTSGKSSRDKPQLVDPTKSNNAFGLPKEYIEKLQNQAIQGSGKIEKP